jgi:hypothetical protein
MVMAEVTQLNVVMSSNSPGKSMCCIHSVNALSAALKLSNVLVAVMPEALTVSVAAMLSAYYRSESTK